jgi:hypothetical protein
MRLSRLACACALAAALESCGGGGSGGPTQGSTPAPTPTPCTQNVLDSGTGTLPANAADIESFSVPTAGRLDITVDWTVASSPIGVYVVPVNSCTLEAFNNRTCTFLVRSEPSSAKPRKISTPNFSAGNYDLVLANFASSTESLSYQVVLSQGSCAALSAGPSASQSGEAMTVKSVGRLH